MMTFKVAPKFLMAIGLLTAPMANYAQASDKHKKVILVSDELEKHVAFSRAMLQKDTYAHPAVIEQFDRLMHKVTKLYFEGEGLIESDVHRILEAIDFAAAKHKEQKRKDDAQTPYIIHPMGVAYNLITIGKVHDTDIIIGGLLHDTVEDTQTSFQEIDEWFGPRVGNFVREVTDDRSLPKEERKQAQILHAREKSAGAAQIKLADKLYNLTDLLEARPSDWEEERVDTYFNWAKAVVDNLPPANAKLKKAVDKVIKQYWKEKSK